MSFGFSRAPDTFTLASKENLQMIHDASLDVLEKTGVRMPSEKCLEVFEKAGCIVDHGQQIVRIPSYVVREALKKGKSIVRLYARNPKYNMSLDGRHVHVTASGCNQYTIDLETGEKRPSVTDDIVKAANIVNGLDSTHMFSPMVGSHDVSEHIRDVHDVKTALVSSEKNVGTEQGFNPNAVPYMIEIAATICGGSDELRRTPIITAYYCQISPLTFDGRSSEGALEFAGAGVPITYCPCPLMGASDPVTLAGSMVVSNAENLAALVLIESAFPGTPFIYGSSIAPLDMRTTRRAGGAIEHGMTGSAMAQLGRYLGLPTFVGGFYTTANKPGAEACIDKIFCGLLSFSNVDISEGTGLIEDGKTLSFEQLVIDSELGEMFHRVARGIEFNDVTLALDLIHKVKPGGTYLTEKHTNDYLRKEHFISNLVKRQLYEVWVNDGSKDIVDLAREKAKKLAQSYPEKPLDKDLKEKIEEIMRRADKELSKGN